MSFFFIMLERVTKNTYDTQNYVESDFSFAANSLQFSVIVERRNVLWKHQIYRLWLIIFIKYKKIKSAYDH